MDIQTDIALQLYIEDGSRLARRSNAKKIAERVIPEAESAEGSPMSSFSTPNSSLPPSPEVSRARLAEVPPMVVCEDGSQRAYDPFIDQLPQEIFLRVLSYLGPTELAQAARVNTMWSAFCGDHLSWGYSYKRKWGYPSELSQTLLRGISWKEIYRIRNNIERKLLSFNAPPSRKGSAASDMEPDAVSESSSPPAAPSVIPLTPQTAAQVIRQAADRCSALERLLNAQERAGRLARADREVTHALLYDAYYTPELLKTRPWLERDLCRRLVSHAQEQRRVGKHAPAEHLLSLAIPMCERLAAPPAPAGATKPSITPPALSLLPVPAPPVPAPAATNDAPPPRVFGGMGHVWAVALMNMGTIALEVKKNRDKADELFLSAQKILLHLNDKDPHKTFNLACVYALCGQVSACKRCLEETFEQGNLTMQWFSDESDFDSVRDQRWFSELLGRVAERDRERQQRELEASRSAEGCTIS